MPILTVIAGGAERPSTAPFFTPRAVVTAALSTAIGRWRADAVRAVTDPACSSGARAIAWRFLRQHGAAGEEVRS